MPTHMDPGTEAIILIAMSAGLGTSVLDGQATGGDALAIVRYQPDRLLPEPRGAAL